MTNDLPAVLQRARGLVESGETTPRSFRSEALRALAAVLRDQRDTWEDALRADLGAPAFETWATQTGLVLAEIRHARRHLWRWMRPRRVGTPLAVMPARSRIEPAPVGVVLVIAPWNYPLQLSLAPAVAAIAAGNAVVIKPSEHAPRTAGKLAELLPAALTPGLFQVVEGGPETAQALIGQGFDHVLFTGSRRAGALVAEAAGRRLTPVTLELGGKCPALVDRSADLRVTARRLAWAKFLNAGQTCVAPDFVLVPEDRYDEFARLLGENLDRFYGGAPAKSPDYGRIVHETHFRRLERLLPGLPLLWGGERDPERRYFGPTITGAVARRAPGAARGDLRAHPAAPPLPEPRGGARRDRRTPGPAGALRVFPAAGAHSARGGRPAFRGARHQRRGRSLRQPFAAFRRRRKERPRCLSRGPRLRAALPETGRPECRDLARSSGALPALPGQTGAPAAPAPLIPPAGGLPFPIDPLRHRPRVAVHEAAAAAGELWGLTAGATPLPGERDANFLLEGDSGDRFVLKVSSAAERPERLDLQHGLVTRARECNPALRLPEAVPTESGVLPAWRDFGGRRHRVRLFRYLEGRPLSAFRRRPHALLESVGRLVGRVQRALDGFDHPELDIQEIPWAPAHAPAVIAAASGVLRGEDASGIYRSVADSIEEDLPDLLALPAGALHNDANDDNLLLAAGTPETAKPEDVALLDFGDAVRGPLICETATAALYTAATAFEPLPAAARVLAGFAGERPLTEEEADLFGVALAARALVSAGVAALRRTRVAGAAADEYLMVSQAGVWRVLRALEAEAAEVTAARFRIAAGFSPLPRLAERRAALQRAAAPATPPVTLPGAPVCLDLSPESPAIDPAAAAETLRAAVRAATEAASVAIGRYLEPRVPETVAGDVPRGPRAEPATLQLGIEIFAPAGTPVRAPLAGAVEWANDRSGEPGTGISAGIRHTVDREVFWTSYRHLDPACRETLVPGRGVEAGETLGAIAESNRSGDAPPHLQFQVLLSTFGGRPPRRTSAADLPVLSALSADPLDFFGLGSGARVLPEVREARGGRLLETRRRRFSSALSISYDVPIRVVRGRGARLYDDAGRDYLDMVNNVAHVGHAHPRVADAISRQAALLNTNTRYLYRQLTDYAERLAETFPAPLEVVFLTNSGSEANDLALRIARAHLGRRETLAFEGGYHGNLTSLIDVSPYKLDGRGGRPRAAVAPPVAHARRVPRALPGRGAALPGVADRGRRVPRSKGGAGDPGRGGHPELRRPDRAASGLPGSPLRGRAERRGRDRGGRGPDRLRPDGAGLLGLSRGAGRERTTDSGHRHARETGRERDIRSGPSSPPGNSPGPSKPGWSTSTPSAETRSPAPRDSRSSR